MTNQSLSMEVMLEHKYSQEGVAYLALLESFGIPFPLLLVSILPSLPVILVLLLILLFLSTHKISITPALLYLALLSMMILLVLRVVVVDLLSILLPLVLLITLVLAVTLLALVCSSFIPPPFLPLSLSPSLPPFLHPPFPFLSLPLQPHLLPS